MLEGIFPIFTKGETGWKKKAKQSLSRPLSEIDPEYAPSKLIRMILWGMKDAVLSSNLIWMCAMCYNCSFNCPQDVRFADAMRRLHEQAQTA